MASTPAIVEKVLAADKEYREGFKALGIRHPSIDDAASAISAFERTLTTPAPFDAFLSGDDKALDDGAKEGLALFLKKGCVYCHSGPAVGGEHLRKFPLRYHRIWSIKGKSKTTALIRKGRELSVVELPREEERYLYTVMKLGEEESRRLWQGFFAHPEEPASFRCQNCHDHPEVKKRAPFPIANTGGFLGEKERKYFRVPILRNVTRTAPYFHNGTVKTLEEAIDIMGRHQSGVAFTKTEIRQLVAFLRSLEGEPPRP